MKKALFSVEVHILSFDVLNRAIAEAVGEHEWFFNQKHVKSELKSGELEYKNGIATIYDID